MSMTTTIQLMEALAPDAGNTNFPYPNLVQSSNPGQPAYTFEGPQINGLNMPGQWIMTRLRRQFGWQEQQASFLTGAFLVPIGDPLVHFEYEIRIWESGTMGVFRQLLNTTLKKPVGVVPGSTSSTAALGIHDLMLKDLGVSNVVIDFVDYPLNPLITSGGKGAWIGHIGFIEYRPARAALPIPDQTIPDPGAVTPSAANNLATSNATVTQGRTTRSAATARQLLNH